MKKLQVFVSSTYKDLVTERQAAVQAILKSGHIPAGMELFAAGDESQMETIRRWIDQSDVYMLILGGRYGSVDETTSLSYTELEFDYAASQGIPAFSVVATDVAIDRKVKELGREAIDAEYGKELKLFRAKVLSRTSSFFDDSKDIKLAVHETLSDFSARKEFVGWIRGNAVEEQKPLLEEITQLSKRNSELTTKAGQLEKKLHAIKYSDKDGWTDEDFREIFSLLLPVKISTKLVGDKATEIGLLELVLSYRDHLVTGIDNQNGMRPLDQLLFFNVLPKIEVHGLATSEKVVGAKYRRKALTPKGHAFLAYIDRLQSKTKMQRTQTEHENSAQTKAEDATNAQKSKVARKTKKKSD